jgi:hypothetical protein
MLSVIERVKWDSSLTAFGSTVECAGSKRTSSKVRASWAIRNIEIHTFYKKRSIQIYEIHVQIRRSISKLRISQRKSKSLSNNLKKAKSPLCHCGRTTLSNYISQPALLAA